jgi:flagellar hook-length control protein FliK
MNAPVTVTPAAVRPKLAAGPESRGSAGGAPFASALDDALSADRPRSGSAASDRGVERRDGRADRATDRAAAKETRTTERTADKAADKTAREADRQARATERADRPDPSVGDDARDADETADESAASTTTATDGAAADPSAAEPAASGLPGAMWALLMGTAVPAAVESPLGTAVTSVGPAVAVPGTTEAGAPLGSLSLTGLPAAGEPVPAPATGAPLTATTPTAPVTSIPSADPAVPQAPTAPTAPTSPATATFAGLSVEIAPTPEQTATAGSTPATAAVVPAGTSVAAGQAVAGAPTADDSSAPATAAETTAAATPVPVAGAGTSGGGAATAGGGTGQDGGDAETQAAPVGATVTGAVAPIAATATAATAATAAVDAVTDTAAAPPVGSQVARQVAVLRGGPDGTQTMTLVLTPENLGPVEVSVTLSKGTVDLTLRGAHDMGRAALLDGLPDLRRDLESAGLSCSRLEVDRDTGGSWLARPSAQQGQHQGQPDRGGQQTPGENRSRPWGAPADTAVSGTTSTSNRSTSSGVDYRV